MIVWCISNYSRGVFCGVWHAYSSETPVEHADEDFNRRSDERKIVLNSKELS